MVCWNQSSFAPHKMALKLHQPIETLPSLLIKIANAQQRENQSVLEKLKEVVDAVDAVLNSFKIKISSVVKNRLPLLNLSSEVLTAVREGKLSPTNATLINRQPQEVHTELLEQASGLSKKDLVAFIKEYVEQATPPTNSEPGKPSEANTEPLHRSILARVKRLQRKQLEGQLMGNSKIQTRLKNIQSLLNEIDELMSLP